MLGKRRVISAPHATPRRIVSSPNIYKPNREVGVEFPRDKVMQDLFFDDVRSKSSLEEANEGGETPAPTPATLTIPT